MPLSSRRIAQLLLAWWLCGCILLGCSEATGPSLLEVTDLSPRSLEAGEVIELKGSGFPEGKAATVTLEGTLYRAGLPNLEGYRVTFEARGESNHVVSFSVGEEIEEALAEADVRAAHATFRGRAVVAFAPRIAGAPPISGVLPDLSVELFSSKGSAERSHEIDEARRLTELLGLAVEVTDRGLSVSSVVAGRGQRAGMIEGDVIVSANGVSVFDATDLLPARQERELTLVVKRSDTLNPWPIRLSIDGFSPLLPLAFSWLFALLIAIATWLILLFSTVRANGLISIWSIATPQPAPDTNKHVPVAVLMGLAMSLLNVVHLPSLASRLLNMAPLVAILLLRPLLGFLAEGAQARRFSLRRATAAAFKIQLVELCAVLGLCAVALRSGGLGPAELRAAQGMLPWQWLAFHSLPTALAALLVLLSSVYDASGKGEASLITGRPDRSRSGLLRYDSALVFLKCAVFVPVFLGGGQHSLVAAHTLPHALLSLLIMAVKYAVLVAVVMSVRSRLGYPSRTTISGSFYAVFALSVVVGCLPLLPIHWDKIALTSWLREGVPLGLCVVAVVGIAAMARWRSMAPSRGVAINPWL